MTDESRGEQVTELRTWTKKQLDAAVYELMDRNLFAGPLLEAKAAWVFPFSLLIGRIRERGSEGDFDWFICGDAPLTHLHSSLASTPREAARHFALQWQLDAARQGAAGDDLARKAEALYELVEQPGLWDRASS